MVTTQYDIFHWKRYVPEIHWSPISTRGDVRFQKKSGKHWGKSGSLKIRRPVVRPLWRAAGSVAKAPPLAACPFLTDEFVFVDLMDCVDIAFSVETVIKVFSYHQSRQIQCTICDGWMLWKGSNCVALHLTAWYEGKTPIRLDTMRRHLVWCTTTSVYP